MKHNTLLQAAFAASLLVLGTAANAQQHVVGSADLDRDGVENRHDRDRDRDGDGVRNARDDFPNDRYWW